MSVSGIADDELAHLLGPTGPLADAVAGYRPRAVQLEMARAVATAISEGEHLLVEAGTGTGKTLAYLLPALAAGRRTVISTGTKNLQDQLHRDDLPRLRAAGLVPGRAVVLKGRANYVCPQRLLGGVRLAGLSGGEMDRPYLADLQRVREWMVHSVTGDLAELPVPIESAAVLRDITSTADNCLGHACPRIAECPVRQAREAAAEADVVIVNHHLLLADLMLKDETLGQVLPNPEVIIVDEAHQLGETARLFFGETVTSRQLHELCRDTAREIRLLGDADPALSQAIERAGDAVRRMAHHCASGELGTNGVTEEMARFLARDDTSLTIAALDEALSMLMDHLEVRAERSDGLRRCFERCLTLADSFAILSSPAPQQERDLHWLEAGPSSFSLHRSPVETAEALGSMIERSAARWIFTSATLAVDGNFDHMRRELGLEETVRTLCLDSPFDYPNQAAFYMPAGLPEPGQPGFTHDLVDHCLPLLNANPGRAFMLFTSHRALQEAAVRLKSEPGIVTCVQGTLGRDALLDKFRTSTGAVLLATQGFWEGVDVRGAGLTLLIIDKLPFASPGDALVRARMRRLEDSGGNAFLDYLVPRAVISLRQGFGRLIRDEGERGLFVLGDTRVRSKGYGRLFTGSLPRMPQLDSVHDACNYLLELS